MRARPWRDSPTCSPEARERNPELQAARARSGALAAVPAQASALDDPTLSYEAWNIPESLRFDQADNNIFRLSQKVPFPGKRALAGQVAAHEAEKAGFEAEGVELDVETAVKRAYYDYWQAYQRLQIFERDRLLAEQFARAAEERYGAGGTQSDALRAQVELTHVVNQAIAEKLAIDSARAELNALLSRSPDTEIGVPEDPPEPALAANATELVRLALDKRPEAGERSAAIAREQSAVDLAHKNYLPDFEFSVGRLVNFRASDGFGAMASVTLPFVQSGKYDAGVQEAQARLREAESLRRSFEDRLRREVQQAVLRLRTAPCGTTSWSIRTSRRPSRRCASRRRATRRARSASST